MPAIHEKKSGIRTPDVPSLAEMVREGQADALAHRRRSAEALAYWFRQAERLCIARTNYKLRGDRFVDFAVRIGVDRSSAYRLVKLHQHRPAIERRVMDEREMVTARREPYHYPGWETALAWVEPTGTGPPVVWARETDDWRSPPKLFNFLNGLFRFDVDVCASADSAKCAKFYTEADDGLKQVWQPGKTHWMNCPYSRAGRWAQKAAQSAAAGAIVVGLFANRSQSGWYRDHVVPHALVIQLCGRLSFLRHAKPLVVASPAPFASILAVWPRSAGEPLRKLCTPADVVLLEIPK
jgi:phage N-6-adenine-methyltransferase